MATEPDNTPFDRFITFAVALLVFCVFGLLALVLLGGKGLLSGSEPSEGSDEALRAKVVKEWQGSVATPEIDTAKVAEMLKTRKQSTTKIVVPGSKTQLEAAGAAAPEPAGDGAAEEKHDPAESALIE